MRHYLKNIKHKTLVLNFHKKRLELIQKIKLQGCCNCGYKKNVKALQFHHLNPADKKATIAQCVTKNAVFLAAEISKCIILCSNCHVEVEDGLVIKNIERYQLKINSEYFLEQKKI